MFFQNPFDPLSLYGFHLLISSFGYGLMGIVIIAIVASILATMFLIYRKNRVASEMCENSSSIQGLSITAEEDHHLL